jgi:vitamin B12 transporter
MMRDLILLFVTCTLLPAQSTDAGSLTIRISDPSGAAVPKATITLTHRTMQDYRSGETGLSGGHDFQALRPGDYIVQAEAEGFGSAVQRISVRPGANEAIDIELGVARLSTQVQVTASGTAQTVDEQSKALDVVGTPDLNRRAEFTLAEAVRVVPGIRVQQLGGPGSFVRILARGMRPSDTSILLDGFRFRDAAAPQGDASGFIGDLMVSGISRVEVLRGSGSSLYGTNATGGVINVIGDQGGGSFHGQAGAEGGGLSMARGFTGFSGGALNDALRYSGSLNHLNVMRGLDGDDRARNSIARAFVHGQIAARTALQGRILASDSFAQLNDTAYVAGGSAPAEASIIHAVPDVTFVPSPDDPDNRRTARHFSGLAALTHAFTPRVVTKLSYQRLATRRDARDGPAGNRFEPEFNNSNTFDGNIDTLEARVDMSARTHLATAGYEFEREQFENLSTDENFDVSARVNARAQISQRSHAVFAQDQIRLLGERLLVSVSGRLQHFVLKQPVFTGDNAPYRNAALQTPPNAPTGDVSAAYFWPGAGTKIRVHLGNSYRAPALFERFGASFFFGSFSAYGDPNLGPERIVAFDGGVDQYLAGSRLRLSSTYFYTRLQETIQFDFTGLISPDTDPYGRFGGYRNTGGGIARGVEFSVEARPARSTTLQMGYTYTNADERRSVFRGGNLRSVRVSDHMVTAVATQRIGRKLDVTFDLFAASNYLYGFGDRAYEFDGPVKADLSANYTIDASDRYSVQVFGRIENMLDRTYFEDGFRTPKTWATVGMKFLF